MIGFELIGSILVSRQLGVLADIPKGAAYSKQPPSKEHVKDEPDGRIL